MTKPKTSPRRKSKVSSVKPVASHLHVAVLQPDETNARIDRLTRLFGEVLDVLDIDHSKDPNARDTPTRLAKMYVTELFAGRYTEKPKITQFENMNRFDQLITVGPIRVRSVCAHHHLPFIGEAYIGVLPGTGGKLLGLSKFARIVDWYSRRPQVQEALTQQILDEIMALLTPAGAAVMITSRHLCMSIRGVNEPNTMMTTTAPSPLFLEDNHSLLNEFHDTVSRTIAQRSAF